MSPPKWKTEIVPSHKFELINIADFHSNSIWTRLRYMWVWTMFFKTVLVLCGDVWICIVLIISGPWASKIQPAIEILIARWIFTGCILLSFLLLAMDFRKAIKVMRSEDISYAVSNLIVSGFYCLQKFDYFCFIEKICNSSQLHDKLCLFVFFQLKGWKHLVVQAPRAVINIMTLVAFMRALGYDFDHLDKVSQLLPELKPATKFTFCVMVFTSLMFVLSGLATLVAIILSIPLVAKVQGNLKEYVHHKMDKRIDNIVKKTTQERAKSIRRQQELEDKQYIESIRHGCSGNGGGGHSGEGEGEGGAGVSSGFIRDGRNLSVSKVPGFGGSTPRRPKPTLPDIDVILANAHEDIRLPSRALTSQQRQRPQQVDQHTFQPHHSNQLHYQPRPHHHYTSHSYNPQHNQYAYHESPPFAHVAATNTSPYHGARRSLSSGRNAAGVGYHGANQHHIQTYQYHSSPPQRLHDLPNRKQSLTSVHSFRTDEGSPVMYQRSLPAAGAGGPPLSKAAQIARYYREQQQYQQPFQQHRQPTWPSQHPLQPSGSSPQQLNQPLHPLQSQHYHDTRPHTPAMLTRAVSDGPENWPAHYGFGTDGSQTAETPSTAELFSIYRPDSGVLPDQNDPYYRQFAMQKSGEHISSLQYHDESAEGSGYGSGPGANELGGQAEEQGESTALDRRGSSGSAKANLVYQPDKTELEHYDNLYKGITETHLRVKATRSMSVHPKSPRVSLQSPSPKPSYARALRQQQQQQLLDQRGGYSQVESLVRQQQEQQGNSGDGSTQNQDHDLPEVAYIRPPPPTLNQYYTSPLLSSSSFSSTTRDHHHTQLVHHPSMSSLHQQYQQQQQQQPHNRFYSSSSLRSAYTTASPSSASFPLTVRAPSEHLRDKYSHSSTHPLASTTRDHHYGGKEERFSQHWFPIVVPPSPLPLDQDDAAEEEGSLESGSPEIAVIRIEDILNDLASSLGSTCLLPPPPSTVLPPNPVALHGSTAAVRSSSRAGTPIPRSRTPVNGILPPPPSGAPPMSTTRITTTAGGHGDNVKVEVFEDRNIKTEVRDEEEKTEIEDEPRSVPAPVPVPVQEIALAAPAPVATSSQQQQAGFVAALKDVGAEEDDELMAQLEVYDDEDNDVYGYDRGAWREEEVEFELQPKRWSTIKQQPTRLSSESARRDTANNTANNSNTNNTEVDPELPIHLRTANTSKPSLASSIMTTGSAPFKSHHQFYNHRSGTPPIPPVPSSPPPPVPTLTSIGSTGSSTNLASALRKGMVIGSGSESYAPSWDSLDQVRTCVERATASASASASSPRAESKLRMSSDRERRF
ncbi:hypothetical protein BGW39_009412 [Mortierella sp. 14UC]|nr:hypothetical protein BGW39_009412 [Mortierella sp. 14UC]